MQASIAEPLMLAACLTFAASFFVLSRYLPRSTALVTALIKVGLVVVFFGYFNSGQFTLRDDLTYLRNAGTLYERGFDAIDVLASWKGIRLMAVLSSGWHIGYLWWNLLAIGLFGDHYFSAVFLNVLITCGGGWIARQLALESGFDVRYANGSAVLFLLHWELLAWSSIVNVKDVPVCVLTLGLIYGVSKLAGETASAKDRRDGFFWVVATSFLLFWIRFYLPALVFLAASVWLIASHSMRRRQWGLGLLAVVGTVAYLRGVGKLVAIGQFDPASMIQGSIRFLLTPQPWSVDPKYGFLIVPAVLHLIWFLPAAYGAIDLAKQSSTFRLLLWCGLVVVVFYGIVDELQGPRHRLQILALWSWAQWHFAAKVLLSAKTTNGTSGMEVARA